jgi:uncharacterized membrane protein YeaQ/YmgE (transglycosylase-associated protein family)
MTLLLWLVVGVVTGVLAKRVVPAMNKSSMVFAALIATVGAFFGGFAGEISGAGTNLMTEAAVAIIGAGVVLFFYRQYLSDLNTGL